MKDAARRRAGYGAGGLCTQHGQSQLFQRGGEGGATIYTSSEVPGSALQVRRNAEPQVPTKKDTLANKSTDSATTAIGGASFATL